MCESLQGNMCQKTSLVTLGAICLLTYQLRRFVCLSIERADETLYLPPTEGKRVSCNKVPALCFSEHFVQVLTSLTTLTMIETKVPSRSGSGAGKRDLIAVDELTLDPVTFDPPSNMYMEACQIFLCPSFSTEQVAQYKKVIRLAGGIHIPEYDQREVTHIVVPSNKLETRYARDLG